MDELLKALEEVYNDDLLKTIKDEYDEYFDDEQQKVMRANRLCTEYLIREDGSINSSNIKEVENAGYNVFPVEKDSFGWLAGCVRKKDSNKILLFGAEAWEMLLI